MSRQDDDPDPMIAAIEEIIKTMHGDGPEPPDQPEGFEVTLREAAAVIDSVAGRLLDIERSLATAEEPPEGNAPDVSAQLRNARGLLQDIVGLLRHLATAGLPPAFEYEPDAESVVAPDEAGASAHEVRKFIDWLRLLLPEPADRPAGGSPAADRATMLCEALADLASGLVILANVVTGPISLHIQQIAKGLRAPLVATGVELALAAAKEMAGGELDAELTGQRCADAILGFVSPGSRELKATAFVLRLTGTIACLAAGVRPTELHTPCPCYPDLLSDTGSAIVGS